MQSDRFLALPPINDKAQWSRVGRRSRRSRPGFGSPPVDNIGAVATTEPADVASPTRTSGRPLQPQDRRGDGYRRARSSACLQVASGRFVGLGPNHTLDRSGVNAPTTRPASTGSVLRPRRDARGGRRRVRAQQQTRATQARGWSTVRDARPLRGPRSRTTTTTTFPTTTNNE